MAIKTVISCDACGKKAIAAKNGLITKERFAKRAHLNGWDTGFKPSGEPDGRALCPKCVSERDTKGMIELEPFKSLGLASR